MKKIVISSNTSWFIYNFRLPLIKHLQEKGFLIEIIAPFDEYLKKLGNEGCSCHEIVIDNKGKNFLKDIKTFLEYLSLYKKIAPDLTFHFTIKPVIYGSFASTFLKIPTINTITGLGTAFLKQNLLNKIVKFLYFISQKKVQKIIFLNRDDYTLFIQNKIIKEEKSLLIQGGEGVDETFFSPQKKELNKTQFVFLLMARMIYDKGIGEYVEASKIVKEKYPNTSFQLLGFTDVQNPSAITIQDIKKWEEANLVEYLGKTDDVRPYIANSDCVVLPSYREGSPRTLLEALSMERPIIATDVAGCREMVKNEKNGFLCEVKNSKDLADKMIQMIELEKEERYAMGKYGREMVKKEFSIKTINKTYIEMIESLI